MRNVSPQQNPAEDQASSLAAAAAAVPCHVPFSNCHRDEEGREVFWTAGNSHRHHLKNKKLTKCASLR